MGIVAIVGRPNVGKSTFFNRLYGERLAIVDETEGVTRDRIYGKTDWNGMEFSIIDTGGYITNSEDIFEAEIRKQVTLAVEEADLVLFMTDVQTGITDMDMAIAEMLRRSGKKVIVAVNKVDNTKLFFDSNEFYRLGFDEVYPISSTNGSGTGDLLDAITAYFETNQIKEPEAYQEDIPKVAFVGRPNAGKSTLINTLLGEERNIVTDIPGTTRDTIDAIYNKFGHQFVLVDTAGIRKKRKIFDDLEFYSVVRSVRAIERSDVAVLIIDVTMGITSQDMTIFNIIKKNHKGAIIVMNKWDLVDKDHKTLEEYKQELLKKIAPFTDVPVLFISAKNKKRIFKVIEEIERVYKNKQIKIPTHKLNEVMLPLIEATPPPMYKGKKVKIKYVTQLPSRSVSFAFFCNHPQYIKEPYKRFLENKLRENFELTGVPVNIILREK